jgi:hypothetical protein
MQTIAESIHRNVRVIQTEYDNLTPSLYSAFLASANFWHLLQGEKILIYQEDSIIYRKNINDFLEWDYIGAPWPAKQNDAPILVGNGGFSLRSKSVMLRVIESISIMDTVPNSSTLGYMKSTNSTVMPEDVYFTLNIQRLGLGRVAPVSIASSFSTETIYNPSSLGGHNFWLSDKQWKDSVSTIVPQFTCLTGLKTTHRGGWASVLSSLTDAGIVDPSGKFDFVSVVEEVYMWGLIQLRPKRKWTGIVHCTPNAPNHLKNLNISMLVNNNLFLKDLTSCKVLFTLSEYVSDYLRKHLPKLQPRIVTLFHPVENTGFPEFTMEKYLANNEKYVLQVGQQLRKVTSIFKLHPAGHTTLWLTGSPNLAKCRKMVDEEIRVYNEKVSIAEKTIFYTSTFEEYDAFLEKNIVFVDLYDSAANNTVLECIIRNTPILANRTPGVLEYLGIDYPLYFQTLQDVDTLLTTENLTLAHEYLKSMDKSKFTMDYFVRSFVKEVCA